MTETDAKIWDPRNLIREAYRIDGITEPDCRSIFLDWALGLKADEDARKGAEVLLAVYADQPRSHPMTKVLRESLGSAAKPRRRGGATARR